MDKYLVVGRGLVGSVFSDDKQFDVISHDEWSRRKQFDVISHDTRLNHQLDHYHGIVCTAAISTEANCLKVTMNQLMEANVTLPWNILKQAKTNNIPCIAFSTAGVYRSPKIQSEKDDLSPHNRYTASKIAMEYVLQNESYDKLFIFRIPFVVLFTQHPNDFGERIKKWEKVEDVTASIIYRADIKYAVKSALQGAPNGTYNLASGDFHFPTFLQDRFSWRGDVVPAHSMSMRTPNSILNCDKAKQAGLLTR